MIWFRGKARLNRACRGWRRGYGGNRAAFFMSNCEACYADCRTIERLRRPGNCMGIANSLGQIGRYRVAACPFLSGFITPHATPTTARSVSARKSFGCGRVRIAAPAFRAIRCTVKPAQHFVNWQQDPHGNWLARFVFPEKTTEFSVTVDLIADMEVINPFDFFIEPYAEKWPFSFPSELREDLASFVVPEPASPLLADLIELIPRDAAQHRRFSGRTQPAYPARWSAI